MTEGKNNLTLEQELDALYAAPLSEPFIHSLKLQLNSKVRSQSKAEIRPLRFRPVWILLIFFFVVLILTTIIIGPAKVYAEVRRILGYIPGVGLVDTGSPIRVLAEPVEQTRDGVTITVTSATLTADRTQIDMRYFGVPRSAYPEREDEPGCIGLNYLLLPDGTRMDVTSNMPAIPMDVTEVTFVIPCIANTLPGSVPEDWEFKLKFVPAPPDFTVVPVIEITPTATNTPSFAATDQQPVTPTDNSVKVNQVIETEKGYILLGEFTPPEREGGFVQTIGMPVFTDADGTNVPIRYPEDINSLLEGVDSWAFEFNAIGVKFPLTITFNGVLITQPDPEAQVEVPFDFGETVVQGQEWRPDIQIELAGHRVKLVEITADSRGGYNFHFKMDPEVYGVRVEIEGYTPNGGGGGGGGGLTNGDFHTSVAYAQLPTGKVTLLFSNLSVISDPLEWQTTWSPATERTDLPETYELPEGTCGDINALQSLPTLPSDITGKVLVSEQLPDSEDWGLVLYNLDGTGRTLVKKSGTWGALSADGSKITYSVDIGFEVYDVASGVVTPHSNAGGYNPVWSNDGTRYAYVRGAAEGVSVMDVTTSVSVPVSSLGWETVVGWLPDDSRLIIAAMYGGGVARQIRSVDPQTGAYDELFEIEDASAKSINAALSPDGQWIAYRAKANNGVRIMKMDGSQGRLLLDTSYMTLSGMVWSDSGWLGVSLLQGLDQPDRLILVDPESCRIYKIPGVSGTLKGLLIN